MLLYITGKGVTEKIPLTSTPEKKREEIIHDVKEKIESIVQTALQMPSQSPSTEQYVLSGKTLTFRTSHTAITFAIEDLTPERLKELAIYYGHIAQPHSEISFWSDSPTIRFCQSQIISKLDKSTYPELTKINTAYHGLCELMCNRIMMKQLLGKADPKNKRFFKKQLSVEALNEERVKESHLLHVYSFPHKLFALTFGVYPNNLFSYTEQQQLLIKKKGDFTTIDRVLLVEGLMRVEKGETLKLEGFSLGLRGIDGHSMLIKKISANNYIFFDPNFGEYRDLSLEEIISKISLQATLYGNIVLMREDGFLADVASYQEAHKKKP